jgi:ZIP family zinc transporter
VRAVGPSTDVAAAVSWGALAASSLVGFAIADSMSGELEGGFNGFAAGALLVMLADSMIPEARKAGRTAGLATALGLAVAAGLSSLS